MTDNCQRFTLILAALAFVNCLIFGFIEFFSCNKAATSVVSIRQIPNTYSYVVLYNDLLKERECIVNSKTPITTLPRVYYRFVEPRECCVKRLGSFTVGMSLLLVDACILALGLMISVCKCCMFCHYSAPQPSASIRPLSPRPIARVLSRPPKAVTVYRSEESFTQPPPCIGQSGKDIVLILQPHFGTRG